jgi:hypothetical protein
MGASLLPLARGLHAAVSAAVFRAGWVKKKVRERYS